jgi:predicted RNA-binding protein YlqC (UPF0109 family)
MVEFSDLAVDMVCALTLQPSKVDVSVGSGENGEILVGISAPRSEVAMIVGKKGATAAALHRVLSCIARNWGHEGDVRLAWQPTDAPE